jgi:ElaB/YqjD/DUF883 family membrane-anchored ribosome-binding protein
VWSINRSNISTEELDMYQPGTLNPASAGSPTSPDGNGSLARAVSDASATAHGTIDKVSNAARPAVDRLATGAHQAVDKLAGAANTAAESLAARTQQIKSAHAGMTEGARDYVRANPLASVGIALAAGIVLSRLIRPR